MIIDIFSIILGAMWMLILLILLWMCFFKLIFKQRVVVLRLYAGQLYVAGTDIAKIARNKKGEEKHFLLFNKRHIPRIPDEFISTNKWAVVLKINNDEWYPVNLSSKNKKLTITLEDGTKKELELPGQLAAITEDNKTKYVPLAQITPMINENEKFGFVRQQEANARRHRGEDVKSKVILMGAAIMVLLIVVIGVVAIFYVTYPDMSASMNAMSASNAKAAEHMENAAYALAEAQNPNWKPPTPEVNVTEPPPA